jgi:hypothetical protein
MYEIVLVNLKSEEIIFYPLRFPVCPNCGKFSHYILYLEPPTSEINRINHITDVQNVIHFCPTCNFAEEKSFENFIIYSLVYEIEEMSS